MRPVQSAKRFLGVVLAAALAGCGIGDGSPGEADMKQALENRFAAINAELEDLADTALIGGGGSHGQGRFVKDGGDWMFLSLNQ